MIRPLLALALLLPLSACAPRSDVAAALAPRAAEAIDPRAPLPPPPPPGPPSAAVANEIERLRASGQSEAGRFDVAINVAAAAAARAGAAQSESWIEAQQLLSAAQALRATLTAALAGLDALQAARIAAGGIMPGDRVAIEAASDALGALDRAQASQVRAVAARLGG